MCRIQGLLPQIIPEFFQGGFELVEAGPSTHVDDVFDNDPAGMKRLGIAHDLECGCFALLATGFVALGWAVIGTFGGGEDEVYWSQAFSQGVNIMVLKATLDKFGFWEIYVVDLSRQRPKIECRNDFYAGLTSTPAATSGTTKQIKRPNFRRSAKFVSLCHKKYVHICNDRAGVTSIGGACHPAY